MADLLAANETASGTTPTSPRPDVAMPQAPEPRGLPYATWPLSRTLIGALGGLLIGGVLLPAPIAALDPGLESSGARLAAQALLGITFLGAAILVADGPGGLRMALARLGARRFAARVLVTVPAAFAFYLACLFAYSALVGSPEQTDLAREMGLGSGIAPAVAAVLLIAGLAPLAEELFFRGMLFGGLRRYLPFLPAALLSAALFGSLHLTTGASSVPPLALFGFLLAWVYERTGSIWPAVILHALNNSLALAIG